MKSLYITSNGKSVGSYVQNADGTYSVQTDMLHGALHNYLEHCIDTYFYCDEYNKMLYLSVNKNEPDFLEQFCIFLDNFSKFEYELYDDKLSDELMALFDKYNHNISEDSAVLQFAGYVKEFIEAREKKALLNRMSHTITLRGEYYHGKD